MLVCEGSVGGDAATAPAAGPLVLCADRASLLGLGFSACADWASLHRLGFFLWADRASLSAQTGLLSLCEDWASLPSPPASPWVSAY